MSVRARWLGRRSGRTDVACRQCDAIAPHEARWCGACGAPLRPGPEPDATDATDDAAAEGATAGDGRAGRVVAATTVAAVLLGLLVVQAAQPDPVVPAGYSSRGDGARTGVVSVVTPARPTGVAWRTPVELPPLLSLGADVLDTTTTADGQELAVVLDPSDDGQRVTTHDVTTGDVVSTTMLPLGSQPYATVVGSAGTLAHRDLGTVTLVELATGARRWTVEARLRDVTTVVPEGVVGVLARSGELTLTLLGAADGATLWQAPVVDADRVLQLLPAGDVVLAVTEGAGVRRVSAHEVATGAIRWTTDETIRSLGSASRVAAPVVTDGVHALVLGEQDVGLVRIDDGAVTLLDLAAIGLEARAGAVDGDTAVLTDAVGTMAGFDTSTGAVRWVTDLALTSVFSVAARGGVVAVRADSATGLFDAATGATLGRTPAVGTGTRATLTADGDVVQLRPTAELELATATGVQWSRPTVAVHLPDLATDDGAVALTTPSGVEVLDVADGVRRFAHEAFRPALVTAGTLTAPALADGRVTVAPPLTQPPDRGGLASLFADTGIVDWARRDDRVVPRGTPVVDRDLHVLPVGSQLLGFDRTDGVRRLVVETSIARTDVAAAGDWLVAVDAPRDVGDVWVGRRSDRRMVFRAPIRTCAPPVIHGELALLSTHLGDLLARRLEDGAQPWGERARGSACRPLTVIGDTLVALVDDRELLGVGLGDGETSWRVTLGATAAGAPVAAGELLLVPTLAGTIEAWRPGTDAPAWTVDVGAVPAGAVAVDGDTLLVLTRAGELTALR